MFYFYCLKSLIKNLEKFTPINLTNKGFCCLYCLQLNGFFYPFILVVICTQQIFDLLIIENEDLIISKSKMS